MSEKLLVILLGYKSKAGKDTFFQYVQDKGFKRAAFADKLKQVVMDQFIFTHEQMYGGLKDVMDNRYHNTIDTPTIIKTIKAHATDPLGNRVVSDPLTMEVPNPDYKPYYTPRRILQIYGGMLRQIYPDIWASYVFNSAIPKMASEGHRKFIITVLRFPNELVVAEKWAQRSSGAYDITVKAVKIDRPGVEAESGAGDISENALNDFKGWEETVRNSIEGKEGLLLYKEKCLDLVTRYEGKWI